ncbi:MAG: phosphatidylserine decarboxylase family protein [Gemmatimonadota bacterium]|nr:phosphatidylserine decarboxylase family protein [Gemmatimonadota bacterium]MDE2871395.1 phosphatidylserine decarboxylase family protein [Gemmatimonadota bacterium]
MTLPFAREGLPFILLCLAAAGLAAVWARSGGWGMRSAAPALLLALTLFVAYFFRDPERHPPQDPRLVVAPADGRVISVGPADGEDFMDGTATRVTIFLSIFDVHVQRAPLGGRVARYSRRPGRFVAAWREEAGTGNERASLGIDTGSGPVLVRQIAGLVARRIATYPREGDTVARGDRIGLIRFGSRVDLFVPAQWPVAVQPGDRVRGGETPVARMPAAVPGPAAAGVPR